jgi:bcr-type benzoyl-CoA reductase subunit C
MITPSIEPFERALSESNERLERLSLEGKKIIGYFCTYTPIELIHAAGFVPVRIMGGEASSVRADSLVPDFICPYLRSAIGAALEGRYDFLSGLIQGYTCDVACGVANVWERNLPGDLFHLLAIPYNVNAESRRFFKESLGELTDKLQRAGGKVTEESLSESLDLYKRIRDRMLSLHEMRARDELPVPARDLLIVTLAGFVMPPKEYLTLLDEFTSEAERTEASKRNGPRILVSGGIIEDPNLLAIIEDCGAVVAGDDLCTGLRHFHPSRGEGEDPFDQLVDRYLNRFPCPSRSRVEDRLQLLPDLIERSGTRGVVFLFQKFCTPHLADHPALSEGLRTRGIPNTLIEIEEGGVDEGRMRTRLEAFFEMLA